MTENEIKNTKEWFEDFIETYALSNQETIEFKKALACLEELQQYRAIGTVEGYENAIEAYTETYILMKEYKSKSKDFEAIGTIDDFKALKEEVELYRNLDKTNFSDGYNRAIDEFADELINHSLYADIGKGNETKMEWVSPVTRIKEVAEQMKGGAK